MTLIFGSGGNLINYIILSHQNAIELRTDNVEAGLKLALSDISMASIGDPKMGAFILGVLPH